MQAQERLQIRSRAGLHFPQQSQAANASAKEGEGPAVPLSSLPRRTSPISESGEPTMVSQRVYVSRTTSSDNTSAEGASTTTSDPYMALVDELIEKGSEFSFKGTDDELDNRSSIETSLGYEDLGAAEQDMRIRRRRWQSRRKWERVDSALAYSGQEILTQSLPAVRKYPGDALADSAEGQQNLSSIYLATESAPASPFGSTHPVHPQTHQRSTSQQSVDQRMDSAQDVSRGAPRYGIPRSALVSFVSALPVIHSPPPSETAGAPNESEQPQFEPCADQHGLPTMPSSGLPRAISSMLPSPGSSKRPSMESGLPKAPVPGLAGRPSLEADAGRGMGDTPATLGSSSAPASLQIRTENVMRDFRAGGSMFTRPVMPSAFSLQAPSGLSSAFSFQAPSGLSSSVPRTSGPSSLSAPLSGASGAFQSLLSQASGSPSVPARLIRQSDVCKDPVLKSLCDSVQSALNMPYISITALGNRRILSVALNSMPQEARVFGSGPFCSWLLEPSMPGVHSVPDCLSDPLCQSHPAVALSPPVRLFAGVPLVSATDQRLGALCVGSPDPGPLSPEHAKLMTNFAKAVVRRLQALHFVQLDDTEKAAMIEQCEKEQQATVLVNTAAADWHMLHANEAWRQLTGAELQTGVSTGLWESFEFLSAHAPDESSSGHVGEVGCGGFIVRGEAFRARVKHRSVGDSEELMTLLFRPVPCPSEDSPDSSRGSDMEPGQDSSKPIPFTPFYTATAVPAKSPHDATSPQSATCGCTCAVM